MALGDRARCAAAQSVAIGGGVARADYSGVTVLGYNASTGSVSSTAIGANASAGGSSCVVIGVGATSHTGQSGMVTLGANASGRGVDVVAIGFQATVGTAGYAATGAIALGQGARVGASTTADSTGAVSVGDGALVNGAGSIAIGLGATIDGYANALAIGDGATCTAANTGEIGTSSDPISLKGYSDLDWSGGYAQTLGPWVQDDVAASQTDAALGLGLLVTRNERIMTRAGSVLGIVVYSNEARTAGTATVEVTINGTGTGLTAVLNGTDTQTAVATQAKDTDTFTAGQRIGVQITTSSDWAPHPMPSSVAVKGCKRFSIWLKK